MSIPQGCTLKDYESDKEDAIAMTQDLRDSIRYQDMRKVLRAAGFVDLKSIALAASFYNEEEDVQSGVLLTDNGEIYDFLYEVRRGKEEIGGPFHAKKLETEAEVAALIERWPFVAGPIDLLRENPEKLFPHLQNRKP